MGRGISGTKPVQRINIEHVENGTGYEYLLVGVQRLATSTILTVSLSHCSLPCLTREYDQGIAVTTSGEKLEQSLAKRPTGTSREASLAAELQALQHTSRAIVQSICLEYPLCVGFVYQHRKRNAGQSELLPDISGHYPD